ncbi:MAG: hypothetical protein V1746_05770 [bacterium]
MNQRIIFIGVAIFSMAAFFIGCDQMGTLPQHRPLKSEKTQSTPLQPTPLTVEPTKEASQEIDQLLTALDLNFRQMELEIARLNEELKAKWTEKLQAFKKQDEELKTSRDFAALKALNQTVEQVLQEVKIEWQKLKETATPPQREVEGVVEETRRETLPLPTSTGKHFEQKTEESSSVIKDEVKDGVRYYHEKTSEKMESIKEEVKYRSSSDSSY